MNKKFLTVFAVFDDKTQQILNKIQQEILKLGLKGSQTMDIPFHISLGTYETEDEAQLVSKIKEVCDANSSFGLDLTKVNSFGTRVLFIEPKVNDKLLNLRNLFNHDINKNLQWHAHATLFIDDLGGQFEQAKQIALNLFKEEINAKIVRLSMGEFFPKRIIIEENLQKDNYEHKF